MGTARREVYSTVHWGNAIGAAAGAGKHVIHTLDPDTVAQYLAEDRQFRPAERLTARGGGTDRAMVLDEEKRAVHLLQIPRHIAFTTADVGEGDELGRQRALRR